MGNGSIRYRIETVFLYVVFICYILFLYKLLLRVPLWDLFNSHRTVDRAINLIPFQSIKEYVFSSSATIKDFAFANVGGNIIVFIPLGTYLTLFKNNKRVMTNLLFIIVASLFIEIIQGLLGIGTSDIDDIILNGLGGFIGILGYKFLLFILRDGKKVRTAITVLSAMGLPVLLFLLFVVRMRL
ncbi:VanZ family protein [Cohnella sp. AR92]|uniref:VanZ family protein n=1 Tax=Cohnella sp. AR92 TaxID=648716 RepID=UPI000F8E48F8|nr:VanZ family protein [Cohnella sp. AR92]RUS42224.1 VanZ family protein [Cohnella sp. AR92]